MIRLWLTLFVCVTFCSGCDHLAASRSTSPASLTAFGYVFEYASAADANFKVEGHRSATQLGDGQETDLDESITIRYAGHTLRIVNGHLHIADKALGMVKPGDRISISPAGQLEVNGVPR